MEKTIAVPRAGHQNSQNQKRSLTAKKATIIKRQGTQKTQKGKHVTQNRHGQHARQLQTRTRQKHQRQQTRHVPLRTQLARGQVKSRSNTQQQHKYTNYWRSVPSTYSQ